MSHPLPPLPNAQYPSADEVDLYLKQRYIKTPRLVRLIRLLRKDHTNAGLRYDVYTLADELYTSTLYDWIDELFFLGFIWYSDSDPHSASVHQAKRTAPEASIFEHLQPETYSLQFATVRLYLRFISYHKIRCVLSGCIQTLCSIPPLNKVAPYTFDFDLTAARTEDIHAASMIAACDAYALSDPSPMKMRRTHLTWPALFSYGTWRRLELRAEAALVTVPDPIASQPTCGDTMLHTDESASRNPATYETGLAIGVHGRREAGASLIKARTMKAWATGVLKWAEDQWGGRVWCEPDMNWVVNVAAGGYLVAQETAPREEGEQSINPTIYEIVDEVNATTGAAAYDGLGEFENTWT